LGEVGWVVTGPPFFDDLTGLLEIGEQVPVNANCICWIVVALAYDLPAPRGEGAGRCFLLAEPAAIRGNGNYDFVGSDLVSHEELVCEKHAGLHPVPKTPS
jgi:hypothetical protein